MVSVIQFHLVVSVIQFRPGVSVIQFHLVVSVIQFRPGVSVIQFHLVVSVTLIAAGGFCCFEVFSGFCLQCETLRKILNMGGSNWISMKKGGWFHYLVLR